ncbi:MAG: DUF4340 domain-containing protein [Rhodospirillales bacterium]
MRAGVFMFLACISAAAVLGAAGALHYESGLHGPKPGGGRVYPDLAAAMESISEIRVKTPEVSLTFRPEGGVWRAAERDGYPADMRKLAETVFGLSELTYAEPKTAMAERYARLHIEDPDAEGARSRRVQLLGPDGAVLVDLITGRRKPGAAAAAGVYIRKTGEARGWLAAGPLDISDAPENWLDSEIVNIAPERIKRAVLTHSGGERVEIARAAPGGEYTALTLPEDAAPKGPRSRLDVAEALKELKLRDAARPENLKFTPEETVKAVYETFDGLTVDVRLSKQHRVAGAERWWARVSARAGAGADQYLKDEAAAINARTEGWAFRLPTWKSARMTKRNSDLTQ